MLESKVQLAPPMKNVAMVVLTPKPVIQLTAFLAFATGRKLDSVCCILLLVPLQTYIRQKKNWALLTDPLKVKNNMPDNCHAQKCTYFFIYFSFLININLMDNNNNNNNNYKLTITLYKS